MKWKEVKRQVEICKRLSKDSWVETYKGMNNFEFSYEEMEHILRTTHVPELRMKTRNCMKILKHYTYRKDFNNVITVKLVIPSGCNAKCTFCYNKENASLCYNKKKEFLDNFIDSLEDLILRIDGKQPISLDITGNEPTFDIGLFKSVMDKLRRFYLKDKICRITLTSNGYNLEKVIPYMRGVVKYVNVSVHSYDAKERKDIFGIDDILRLPDYRRIVSKLLDIGIDASAVCVLHKDIPKFNAFLYNFVTWCKYAGFQSLRIRNDVFWKDSKFDEYFDMVINNKRYYVIQKENTNDSTWCRVSDNEGFFIFMLKGVFETGEVSKGIEYVIADDGLCYTDFHKKEKIEDYQFPVGLVFDKKL